MDVQIMDPQATRPTDTQILSFWRLVFSPEMLRWNPDDDAAMAGWDDGRVVQYCRDRMLVRSDQCFVWAVHCDSVVGTASINVPSETSRSHCGEVGVAVGPRFRRQGLGLRLLRALEQRGHERGLHRLECGCISGNAAAVALLSKAGYSEEGRRSDSLRQGTRFVTQILFGKIIPREGTVPIVPSRPATGG